VVRGAFALGLVFSRNPNPDADVFAQKNIFFHILLHIKKLNGFNENPLFSKDF